MDNRKIRIKANVSIELFHFATAVVRMHSNATRRFANLPDAIDDLTKDKTLIYEGLEKVDAELHLRLIPSNGDVLINVMIYRSTIQKIKQSISILESILQTPVTLTDALSLLMLEYVARDRSQKAFDKIIKYHGESQNE